MSIKLCRICLSTDKPLLELNEKLLDYYQDICDYSSGFSKHLCCFKCKDSLKYSLDFRNKCLKSNKILQNWKSDNNQKKSSIHSLQKLLKTYLDDTEAKKSSVDKPKSENIPELCYEITSKSSHYSKNNENILKNDNGYSICDIKDEIVKDEVKNDELFEVIDCGTEHHAVNDVEVNDMEVNDVGASKKRINVENDVQINGNDDLNDNNESDDDKFLIDCASPKRKSKRPRKEVKKSKAKVKKLPNQGKRVYPRKGISEYSQYEAVFDIQLFNTDEDARHELSQRRVSEPYLSARYRCEMCYTVYKCEKLLQFHMKWHGPGDYVCDICSMCFAANKALYCHKAKCHRGRFACKLCPLITYYGSAMKAHFQKHQGKTFKCHCDRIFNKGGPRADVCLSSLQRSVGLFIEVIKDGHISSYLSHARLVHASRHVCVTCARTFVSELGLLNHRLRAHQTKSKVDSDATAHCEPCALTFANQQVYTVHVLNTDAHKDIAKDMIACPYCGVAFEDAAQLKSHKRQNHPKKKDTNDIIKCKLCDAEGAGRTWRRRHYGAAHPHVQYLEEVSEAKLHMCERCGKRFSNICIMKDHMNTHLGVKPYACDRCRATFSSWGSRAAHCERHHAPPRRACALCGARFRSASNLAVHMRTHSGVRRHSCTTCGAAFLHRAALREHEQGVHRHVRRVRGKPRSE